MAEDWAAELLKTCLGLKAGERFLVLVDEPLGSAGECLVEAAHAAGAGDASLRLVDAEARRFQVISQALLSRVAEADAIVSLFAGLAPGQPNAILQALLAQFRRAERGRWAFGHSVSPAHPDLYLAGDYHRVSRLAQAVSRQLAGVDRIRIQTDAGSDLSLRISGRPVLVEDGLLRLPGSFCNLPAGEVYVAPLEQSADGELVVDVSAGGIALAEPLHLRFREGRLTALSGPAAPLLERLLGLDPHARTIGEFGIGVNPFVPLTGRTPVDEKALGTIHIALGGNTAFGGENPAAVHCDCVVRSPRVTLDTIPMQWPE